MISVIHYCNKEHPLNGNIFYHFEYFIFLLKHKVDVELVIVSDSIDLYSIIDLMEDRYDLKDIDYKHRIVFSFYNLTGHNFDKVITNAKTAMVLKDNIKPKEIHIVQTWDSYEHNLDMEFYSKYYDKIYLYNENPNCGEVNYIRAMYLDLLKKPETSDDAIYLHVCGVREISTSEFIKHVLPKRDNKKIIVSLPDYQINKLDFYKGMNFVEGFNNHVPNLFSKFDTYFYILMRGIDYSPRMLIECSYLEKDIIYINKNQNDNQRYLDILNNDIDKYNLTNNDFLIGRFL